MTTAHLLLLCATLALATADPALDDVRLGFAAHRGGDAAEALSRYAAAAAHGTLPAATLATVHANAGALHLSAGSRTEAVAAFEAAMSAAPERADVRTNLAIALSDDPAMAERALALCHSSLELRPGHAGTLQLVANLLQDRGDGEAAARAYAAASGGAADFRAAAAPVVAAALAGLPRTGGPASAAAARLAHSPALWKLPGLLDADECAELRVAASAAMMTASKVQGGTPGDDGYRNSSTAWLPLRAHPVAQRLRDRVVAAAGLPARAVTEALQVVRYESGGEFRLHTDTTGHQPRPLTLLVYLSDGDGAATHFPLASAFVGDTAARAARQALRDRPFDGALFDDIRAAAAAGGGGGVRVERKRGDGVLFANHLEDGRADPAAVHAGEAVPDGQEKWIANLWFAPEAAQAEAPAEEDTSPEGIARAHIASAPVAVFSKSTCPFCKRTKKLFEEMGVAASYLELDKHPDGRAIQTALKAISGQRTVPNTFVHGQHLGGNDDAQREAKSGALQARLSGGGGATAEL